MMMAHGARLRRTPHVQTMILPDYVMTIDDHTDFTGS